MISAAGQTSGRRRGSGQHKVGTVVSIPGMKSVTIRVERLVAHPVYKRRVRRSKKFMAHDEQSVCKLGDTVEIVETRPLSARKRWRVVRVVQHAEAGAATILPAELEA